MPLLPRSPAARGALLVLLTAAALGARLNQTHLQHLTLDRVEEAAKAYLPTFASEYVAVARSAIDGVWGGAAPLRSAASGNCGWVTDSHFAVTSSRVVTPNGVIAALVKVKDGLIEGVMPLDRQEVGDADALKRKAGGARVLDYGELVLSPGLIDVHTHLNEPGRVEWEGFETGTQAAAAGGVTLLVDMPLNSAPAMTTAAELKNKIAASRGKLFTNVALWGGLVPANAHDPQVLTAMAEGGVVGFKAFISPSGINDFPNSSISDVAAAFPTLSKLGIPVMVHAELVDESLHVEGDPTHYATYMATRPPEWEQNCIRGLLRALSDYVTANDVLASSSAGGGFNLHIAHLADAGSLEMIKAAKAKQVPVTVETCVHYLNFAAEEIPNGDVRYKCAPPLRTAENRAKLRDAVKRRDFDIISTDHSPAPPSMKQGHFLDSWGGISGLQYALPGTWHVLSEMGMHLEELSRVWSTEPAKLLGVSGVTGKISVGKQADFVVWDPDEFADTSQTSLLHKHKLTPYQDMKLKGRVKATFVNGQQVFDESRGVFAGKACGSLKLRKQ